LILLEEVLKLVPREVYNTCPREVLNLVLVKALKWFALED